MLLPGHAQRGRTGEHECEVCLFPDMHRREEFEKKKKKTALKTGQIFITFLSSFFKKKNSDHF